MRSNTSEFVVSSFHIWLNLITRGVRISLLVNVLVLVKLAATLKAIQIDWLETIVILVRFNTKLHHQILKLLTLLLRYSLLKWLSKLTTVKFKVKIRTAFLLGEYIILFFLNDSCVLIDILKVFKTYQKIIVTLFVMTCQIINCTLFSCTVLVKLWLLISCFKLVYLVINLTNVSLTVDLSVGLQLIIGIRLLSCWREIFLLRLHFWNRQNIPLWLLAIRLRENFLIILWANNLILVLIWN